MTMAPGTTYLTAKTPGSAGNVPIAGTLLGDVGASATGMLGGLDPLSSLYLQVANLFDLAGKRAALDAVAADQVAGARGLTEVSHTLITPASAWDIGSLGCDTRGPLWITFDLEVTGDTSIGLRINGSTANVDGKTINLYNTNSQVWGGNLVAATAHTGDRLTISISCPTPESTHLMQTFWVNALCWKSNGTWQAYQSFLHYKPVAPTEIDQVGLTTNNGNVFKATSTCRLTRRIAP